MNAPAIVCVTSERVDVLRELLGAALPVAEALGGTVVAVPLAGTSTEDLFARGADRVLVPSSSPSEAEGAVAVLDAALGVLDPVVLLIGATNLGAEAAARLAQRRRIGCASEIVEIGIAQDGPWVRRRCLGRFVATERQCRRPTVATIRPRRYAAPARGLGSGVAERLPVVLPTPRVRVRQRLLRSSSDVCVEDAERIVAVGRGLQQAADLELIHRAAAALNAVVAGSRPVTEHLKWLPIEVKVGLSGRTVRPELYLACGISGQIEHIVGMRESRVVVAVNSDGEAPIFREADYCVVADLYRFLPELVSAVGEQLLRP